MQIQWKTVESRNKPLEIDKNLSSGGVYLRIDIQEVIFEDSNEEEQMKFVYKEAFLTNAEFEQLELLFRMNGDEVNGPLLEYQYKMDTPVEYPANGFTYKPKWAEKIYAGKIQLGAALPALFPLEIYDSTETVGRMEEMSIQELTQLSMFLGNLQKQYFSEYKAKKAEAAA